MGFPLALLMSFSAPLPALAANGALPETAPQAAPETAPASPPLSPGAEALLTEANGFLLAGDTLPPDFMLHVRALPPGERLLVVVHLRRAGLVQGAALSESWLLDPAGGPP